MKALALSAWKRTKQIAYSIALVIGTLVFIAAGEIVRGVWDWLWLLPARALILWAVS